MWVKIPLLRGNLFSGEMARKRGKREKTGKLKNRGRAEDDGKGEKALASPRALFPSSHSPTYPKDEREEERGLKYREKQGTYCNSGYTVSKYHLKDLHFRRSRSSFLDFTLKNNNNQKKKKKFCN